MDSGFISLCIGLAAGAFATFAFMKQDRDRCVEQRNIACGRAREMIDRYDVLKNDFFQNTAVSGICSGCGRRMCWSCLPKHSQECLDDVMLGESDIIEVDHD